MLSLRLFLLFFHLWKSEMTLEESKSLLWFKKLTICFIESFTIYVRILSNPIIKKFTQKISC